MKKITMMALMIMSLNAEYSASEECKYLADQLEVGVSLNSLTYESLVECESDVEDINITSLVVD